MNKGKKIVFDMFLNIVATAIPTFVLQLIILPLISGKMESQNYGLLVTILALLKIVPSTMGNVLNNIRLLLSLIHIFRTMPSVKKWTLSMSVQQLRRVWRSAVRELLL